MRTDLGAEAGFPEGKPTCVTVGARTIAVFKVSGKTYALDNTCTHLGGPLCKGRLDGFVVQCPCHGSRVGVRSGQAVGPPARAPAKAYPVTVEAERLCAHLPSGALHVVSDSAPLVHKPPL